MATYYLDYENGNNANSGADWANAWKDLTNGATAARIAPGDTIRIAKSPDPVSLGITATWTNLSKTVTLASALTLEVDDCDSGWTAANSSTVTHPTTTHKEGSAHVTVTKATYATATLYAYKALAGSTDFSAYDALTFWVRTDAAIADAVRWKVCLCSDAAGTTIVDTFWVPAIASTQRWLPVSIAKDGGGSLGASIQSVAIYTGTSAPTGGQDLLVDNITACTYGGLSLCSLISKNSAAQGGTESWYGIQSIVGTTVLIDNDTNTTASAGRGYAGTTETVTTYRRETIKTTPVASSGTAVQTVQESGTASNYTVYSGGWDTGSTTQNGESIFDGANGYGIGFSCSSVSFVSFVYMSAVRYWTGLSAPSAEVSVSGGDFNNCQANGVSASSRAALSVRSCSNNGSTGIVVGSNSTVTITHANNNLANGVQVATNGSIVDITNAKNNATAGLNLASGCDNVVTLSGCADNGTACVTTTNGRNTLIDSTLTGTEVASLTDYLNGRLWSQNHDLGGYDWVFTDGGTINSEATSRAGGTGKMWKLLTSSTGRVATYPLDFLISPIALKGGETNTVSVWMSKAHATNVNGRLVCRGGQVDGIAADVTDTLADNTSWQELSLTLSPTDDCVVMIEAWAEYVAGHAAVYVDEISEVSSV